MLHKIDFETDTATGWVEGEFSSPREASEVGSLVKRLSELCRLYENEYFKLLSVPTQQLIESGAVQMRVIVIGDSLEARFYSEDAGTRANLEMSRGFLRLQLMRLARELGLETATSFKSLVFDDETRFRTVKIGETVESATQE